MLPYFEPQIRILWKCFIWCLKLNSFKYLKPFLQTSNDSKFSKIMGLILRLPLKLVKTTYNWYLLSFRLLRDCMCIVEWKKRQNTPRGVCLFVQASKQAWVWVFLLVPVIFTPVSIRQLLVCACTGGASGST